MPVKAGYVPSRSGSLRSTLRLGTAWLRSTRYAWSVPTYPEPGLGSLPDGVVVGHRSGEYLKDLAVLLRE